MATLFARTSLVGPATRRPLACRSLFALSPLASVPRSISNQAPPSRSHHPFTSTLPRSFIIPSSTLAYTKRFASSSPLDPSTPPDASRRSRDRSWSPFHLLLVLPASGLAYYTLYSDSEPFHHVHYSIQASDYLIGSPSEEPPTVAVADGSSSSSAAVTPSRLPRRSILTTLNFYVIEPFLTALRFLHLASLFLPVIILAPVSFLGSRERLRNGAKGDRSGAIWWYGVLVKQMERAGPSFIKLAQWAGSRTDLFPERLCESFGKLHSNGKPHSFKYTKKVIETVFGKPFEEVFEEFGQEPIGCGAVAQVYKGTLRSEILPPSYLEPKKRTNVPTTPTARLTQVLEAPSAPPSPTSTVPTTAVAIKILHPRVHQTIRRDLKIMAFFAAALDLLPGMEWLSFPDEVKVFGEMMNQQLDLRLEASNLVRFEKNFEHRRGAVSFPRPLVDFTTEDMMVEEFENALPLKYFLRNGGGEYDDQLANMGLDAFLNMLLLDNWTHGDLHPGNLLVKFFRPSTSTLFLNLYSYLFNRTLPHSPSATTVQASNESDAIVARLSAVKHDKDAWLAELTSLYEGGWQPELILIDAGLVTELDTTNRRNFLDLFHAIAEFDGYRAGNLMVERCRAPDLAIDKETFALKIQHLVLSVKSKTFSLANIKISQILTEVLSAVRTHHVKMEGDFVNTVLSILLLEGIGRQLDPNMDLFKSALPILRQLGRQIGTGGGGGEGGGLGAAREALKEVKGKDLGAMLKIWVWMEARELVSSAMVDTDAFVKYDWLTPNL